MKMWNACTMFNQAGLQLFLWLQNSSLSEVLQDERIKMFLCASSEVSQFPVCINQNQTQKTVKVPHSLKHSLIHSLSQTDRLYTYIFREQSSAWFVKSLKQWGSMRTTPSLIHVPCWSILVLIPNTQTGILFRWRGTQSSLKELTQTFLEYLWHGMK